MRNTSSWLQILLLIISLKKFIMKVKHLYLYIKNSFLFLLDKIFQILLLSNDPIIAFIKDFLNYIS